ncbi:MAG: hypothetical protein IJK46_03830 [Prevotella sp.]|nr:hypothetical protein [Prevotella sp.]
MIELNEKLKKCLCILERRYQGFWGRIVRGDSIECIMSRPEDAFEVALILKTWVKSFEPSNIQDDKRFNRYGLRIAIGIGEMKTIDRSLDMMDGDAIYRSGRAMDKLVGRAKYSFVISMADSEHEQALQVILTLVNQLLNNATARKCETLCERILSSDTSKTAEKMGISVSGVNQTLKDLGWSAIEQAIIYYQKVTSRL